MSLKLNSSGGGSVTLQEPSTASTRTLTLPDATTTVVGTDTTQTLTNKTVQGGTITSGTAVASTSGTSIDFTGIPTWAKRITMVIGGMSTSGSSIPQVQLGTSGGAVATGYVGTVDSQIVSGGVTASITTGLALMRSGVGAATNIVSGQAVFTNLTGNNWVGTFVGTIGGGQTAITWAATQITLGAVLDRVRLTTVNGTDTFDAGNVNILYEG